jgi:hypothetical protein
MVKFIGAIILIGLGILAFGCGCSRHDPPTYTPDIKVGPPTNSSTVNSWELDAEPHYTQPGVNSGKPYVLKPVPSQRGFEPYDPLATAVYAVLTSDTSLDTRYLSVAAKQGVVRITGSAYSAAQKARVLSEARAVRGVDKVIDRIRVIAR